MHIRGHYSSINVNEGSRSRNVVLQVGIYSFIYFDSRAVNILSKNLITSVISSSEVECSKEG